MPLHEKIISLTRNPNFDLPEVDSCLDNVSVVRVAQEEHLYFSRGLIRAHYKNFFMEQQHHSKVSVLDSGQSLQPSLRGSATKKDRRFLGQGFGVRVSTPQ